MNNTSPVLKQPQSIDEWTKVLLDQELPIFSNTAQKVHQSLDDKNKGALDLASIIMQEPNLTAKLLKIANSSYYNPSKQKVSTITRAIILLGAVVIRDLTIACSFFEAILSSSNKARANEEIAKAIHAAVQSRDLAITMNDSSPEEVFVAGLLHNIGHIAFWCSNSKQAEQINYLIERKFFSAVDAEKQVLGFSLQELSQSLCKSWRFGGLIEESICQPQSKNQRIQIVLLGGEISEALKMGWGSNEMTSCLAKIEKFTGKNPDELSTKIKKNIALAIKTAKQFGANDASKYISNEDVVKLGEDIDNQEHDRKQIQFQVLQDISNHLSGDINLNQLFEMILEGIHRGVGMDRTLFMLLSPDKRKLNEKISLGWEKPIEPEKISICNHETDTNLFFHALHQKEGLWVVPEHYHSLYTKKISEIIGRFHCFVFPVRVEKKAIGLIYCDRSFSEMPFTQTDFNEAKHFVSQASIGLCLYSMRSH